jgi:hypothetical protein
VTCGRNRQEFREALDEAHDDCFQGENDIHLVYEFGRVGDACADAAARAASLP